MARALVEGTTLQLHLWAAAEQLQEEQLRGEAAFPSDWMHFSTGKNVHK